MLTGASLLALAWGSLYGCGDDPSAGATDNLNDASVTQSDDANGEVCEASGKTCGDGGVCAGNVCCTAELACGDVCCSSDKVCSFQQCVTPGAECYDSLDCAANEFCDFQLGTTTDAGVGGGGDASCFRGNVRSGRCLPRPPECAPDAGPSPGGPISCLDRCEVKLPTLTFQPKLKGSWGSPAHPFLTDVMMAPIVLELDDDDCDGKVTARDIPEIVFSTFRGTKVDLDSEENVYEIDGKLRAISMINGEIVEKWVVPNANNATVVNPTKHIAGGNFDGKPGNEIVACGVDGKVYAINGVDGSFLWASEDPMWCFMPAIADLDGDGNVEVIVEGGILNGADGSLKHAFTPALNGPFVVSDLDSDGKLDVITSSRGYDASGTLFVDTKTAESAFGVDTSDWKGPWVGVADFDGDKKPEVVTIDHENHAVLVWRYDASKQDKFTIVREPVDMNAKFGPNSCPSDTSGFSAGGGAPTIADFNADGTPDVGLAGGIGYVVFDGKKLINPEISGVDSILWSKTTSDCSSASTGSTVFDFDGDGKAEVVYSDEQHLRIYDGPTGAELASICNTTATLSEFPVVADVDNDGQADIVVVSNAFRKTCDETPDDGGAPVTTAQAGVRIFGPANGVWVRTRRVWNEHAYHVTNVQEDGTIPTHEPENWKQSGLNNFRQNKQTGGEFAAPNAVSSLAPLCSKPGVIVRVRNIGEAVLPAGVVVGVYSKTSGVGTKLGTVTTTRALYPAEVEPLDFVFGEGPNPTHVYAVVDDNGPPHPNWVECRTDDNTSAVISPACSNVK